MGRATVLMLLAAAALAPVTSAGARPAAAADRTAQAENKRLVLAMWHDVLDGRNIAHAPRYIAPDYIQHSPGVGQGRAALMTFLEEEFDHPTPRAPGTYRVRGGKIVEHWDSSLG